MFTLPTPVKPAKCRNLCSRTACMCTRMHACTASVGDPQLVATSLSTRYTTLVNLGNAQPQQLSCAKSLPLQINFFAVHLIGCRNTHGQERRHVSATELEDGLHLLPRSDLPLSFYRTSKVNSASTVETVTRWSPRTQCCPRPGGGSSS